MHRPRAEFFIRYEASLPHCPNCGTDFSEGDACPICEAEVERECARCDESFAGDACPACGLAAASLKCDVHPDREAPGACVVCGQALCPECQKGDGRVYLCADHAGVTVIQGWAQIYSTTRELDAQLLCENLVADDIPARIFSQRDHMFSVGVGDLGLVRLLVPVWEFEHAIQTLRSHMDGQGEVYFACPECGAALEPPSESCPACGTALPATDMG